MCYFDRSGMATKHLHRAMKGISARRAVAGGIVWCAKRYSKDDERWFDLDGNVDLEHPTHWMALPAPPEFGRNHG